MQCPICSNLVPETLEYVKPGQLATIFINEYELCVAARSGECAECKLLFDAISLRRERWTESKDAALSIVVNVAVDNPVQIIWNKAGIFLQMFLSKQVAEARSTNMIPSTIGGTELVQELSGSEQSLSTLQSWFLDCKESHELCRRKEMPILPTRVIDGGCCVDSTDDAHLVDSASQAGEYMALSYC